VEWGQIIAAHLAISVRQPDVFTGQYAKIFKAPPNKKQKRNQRENGG
jgi:hypothetical protein